MVFRQDYYEIPEGSYFVFTEIVPECKYIQTIGKIYHCENNGFISDEGERTRAVIYEGESAIIFDHIDEVPKLIRKFYAIDS